MYSLTSTPREKSLGMRALAFVVCAFAGCVAAALGAEREESPVLKELDAKIAKALAQEKFSQASRDFVKALWEEYKQDYVKNDRPMHWRGSGRGAKAPDMKSYDAYVGKYGRGKRPFLVIAKDAQGRLLVKLEGHTIPALAWNRGILFTTGDVVYSRVPNLGARRHACLEYFIITRVAGRQYVMKSPLSPRWPGRPLVKLD